MIENLLCQIRQRSPRGRSDGGCRELMYGTYYDQIRSLTLWPNGFAWLLRE